MNDPEIKAWLERKVVNPAAAAPDWDLADSVAAWEETMRGRLGGLVAAIPRLPAEFAKVAAVTARDVNAGRPGLVLLILVVLVAVGAGAEWLVRRSIGRVAPSSAGVDATAIATEAAALLAFSLASFGSFVAFDWPPMLRRVVLTLLAAVIAFRFVRTVAGLVLALPVADANAARMLPCAPDNGNPLLAPPNERHHRYGSAEYGQHRAGPGMSARPPPPSAGIGGWAGIETVWRLPAPDTSRLRRILLGIFLLVLWLVWVAGMPGLLWLGIFGLVLPSAVRGAGRLAQALAGTARPTGAIGIVVDVLVVRGARALVIAAAVAWLAYLWRSGASALSGSEIGDRVIGGVLNAIIVILIADLLWQLSKGLINHRLNVESQAAGSDDKIARAARLRTLLPIFRNTLAVFIALVSALTILSGLGVQIGPLIAGAGIFGVAIGFGSQTLVKDVLSGVFFMLDDAFRVGEYIQSGSYMGTVESFSLRSVRLRHHRGPIYTVPFGSLGAIENMSRDWVIDKMKVRVTYDSDVELARKLIKKIGQDLAADPEFAADTIEPLKMQGIDNFGDFAIELKMKLMTKPNTQFKMKRQALMMIKKAFAENGIKIAVPTVHVEGGGDRAAAAQQAVNALKPVPEAAAG